MAKFLVIGSDPELLRAYQEILGEPGSVPDVNSVSYRQAWSVLQSAMDRAELRQQFVEIAR
jgi:hypothetical protein